MGSSCARTRESPWEASLLSSRLVLLAPLSCPALPFSLLLISRLALILSTCFIIIAIIIPESWFLILPPSHPSSTRRLPLHGARVHAARIPRSRHRGLPLSGVTSPLGIKNLLGANAQISRFFANWAKHWEVGEINQINQIIPSWNSIAKGV